MAAQHIDLVLAVLTVWSTSEAASLHQGLELFFGDLRELWLLGGDALGPASSVRFQRWLSQALSSGSPPSKPALNALHPVRMSFRLQLGDFLPFGLGCHLHLQNDKSRSRRANSQQALSSAASICRHEGRRKLSQSGMAGSRSRRSTITLDFGDLAALLGGQAFIHSPDRFRREAVPRRCSRWPGASTTSAVAVGKC